MLAFDQALAATQSQANLLPALQQAIELYNGPLLPDCQEEWVLAERSQREHAYHNALERLAHLCLQQQEPAAAVPWLRRLLLSDPYRESAACLLMQALADSRDRAAMQRVYQELRLRLHNDLNTAPSAQTQALFQQLSRQEVPPASESLAASVPSATVTRRHLPVPLTDLIGRREEIAEVRGWLQRSRLVTLFGAGGVGKTRLAIAAAEAALPEFAEGVWFADLAPLQDASRLAETVARTLGLPEEAPRPAEERLQTALAERSLLLVLDNCEHLQEAVAVLAYSLLSSCPQLKILATSRHILGVTGEQVYVVPTLALPVPEVMHDHSHLATAEKDPRFLLEYEGIELFVRRARQSNPAFRLDRKNAIRVVEICRRLDGIPLALEMAAARLRSLSVGELQARLSDRFRMLTTGNRGGLPRQQSLRALLDWSDDLLRAEERALFHRLSIFVGGFTLAGAVAISGQEDDSACLEQLTSLADKSLLVYEGSVEPDRYRLLETMREYGLERLNATGVLEETRRRHQDYFLQLVVAASQQWKASLERSCFEAVERELADIRTALDYGLHAEEVARSFALLQAMTLYWFDCGSLSEGRRQWDAFLRQWEGRLSAKDRLFAYHQSAEMAYAQNDYEVALRYAREAEKLASELGDQVAYARALNQIATVYYERKEFELGEPYVRKRLAAWQALGDRGKMAEARFRSEESLKLDVSPEEALYREREYLELTRAIGDVGALKDALHGLSYRLFLRGNYLEAAAMTEETVQISRDLKDRWGELVFLQHLGWIYLAAGQVDQAKACMLKSLSLQKDVERKQELMTAMQALADIAMHQERWEHALCLYSITETMILTHKLISAEGRPVSTLTQLEQLRTLLDAETYDRLWQRSRFLSTAQAIDYALAEA